MKRLSIAIDVDGVLADFVAGLLPIVTEVTGKQFTHDDIKTFDFVKALGLSKQEGSAVKKAIGAKRGFAMGLPPYPKARQGIRRLRDLGDVFCVTHPWESNPFWTAERDSWCALHFGIDRVIHAEDKTPYEADLFIDDKASHVRDWMAAWPNGTGVLWQTPHNQTEVVPTGAHSTSSWDTLYTIALAITTSRPVFDSMEVSQP